MIKSFYSFLFYGFCIALLLLTSCQAKPTGCPVIDLDNPSGSIDLKVSELLDNIALVPLETRDNLVLSTAGTSFIVSNHYILANTGEKLLQFDRNGIFIRTLATKGSGPNEFVYINSMLIDEESQMFYYTGMGNYKSISCINLKTGEFPQTLYPDLSSFSIQAVDTQGNIYGFPLTTAIRIGGPAQKMDDSLFLAYRYDPSHKSLTKYTGSHPFVSENRGQVMFQRGDHIFFLSFPYADTLFKVEGNVLVPEYTVKLKNLMTDDFEKGGTSLRILLANSKGTLIDKKMSQLLITREGGEISSITVTNYSLDYLFLSKNLELRTIQTITIDPLAHTIDVNAYLKQMEERRGDEIKIAPAPSVSGLWGYYAVEAYNMIDLIDRALKGNQLSTSSRKALEELSAKIDEESNPVLIIGKIN